MLGGNRVLMEEELSVEQDADFIEKGKEYADQGKTPMYFAAGGRVIGMIAVADVIKQTSAEAVRELKAMGIDVYMLTGDNEKTQRP